MVMNIKDFRSDSALGAHINDGSTKYAQSGISLQNKSSKPFQDIGSNLLGKVDVQTSRPCAIVGPDRVIPSSNCNEGFVRKTSESWPGPESIYRQPPDYPQKMPEYQPTRNISPRQTFQENMQRIMVSPYSPLKKSDDPNFHVDHNVTMLKNVKLNMPSEAKYCEVPYTINPMCSEQKNVRIGEIPGSSINPVATRNAAHGWIPNNLNVHPLKPYGTSEFHQYPGYSSCVGPRPMPVIRPHRTIHEDPGRMYPEHFYQDANVQFKPYPPTKGRYPHNRYDYVNNYSNSFHPPPPFPNHTFDPQKTMTAHSYPLYPQVPLKYIDKRMEASIIDGYQRAGQTNLNVAYRNTLIHPPYGTLQANCMQNSMIPYPPENTSKSLIVNKLPYCNNNKIYLDYESSQQKKVHVSEKVYSSNVNHANSLKGEVLCPNYSPVNMHGMPQYPLYRKDNGQIKNYEYPPHLRSLDPSVNFHNALLRHPVHFSPNAVAISPSDSNTSNDTTQTHTTQDDCGYVSQSSTTSGRSVDLYINGFPNEQHVYKSPEYRHGHVPKNGTTQIPNGNKSSKTNKVLDVRQFLQMWNEGDDEANEPNKDESIPKSSSDLNSVSSQCEGTNKPEELYVLGLVNVPKEELDKYNHLQKFSKLPENIKGYNNIELLNQFEEAIQTSNMRMSNSKPQRQLHTTPKNTVSNVQVNVSPRPVSPLDVEAKISQSVIHKEVGCNFEIKPCSPKMLNVEIATPIQSILEERIIEKLSNPVASKTLKLQKVEKNKFEVSHLNNLQNTHCEGLLKDDTVEINCNLNNIQYTNENSINSVKPNYSLQDLEYNSSVCLASLPRLDNDIELNFPEINQQFINDNNIENVISPSPVKDLPILNSDQLASSSIYENQSAQRPEVECITPSAENDKEVTKLSKYRKLKRNDVNQKESHSATLTQTQLRTDSVIIKNPEMIKDHEIAPDSPINNYVNKIPVLCNEENNLNDESFTKIITDVVEFKTPTTNENEKKSNISDSVNENLDISMDTALDFSLNKNESELVKVSPFKENNGNDSLVSFIEEDMIPKKHDESELFMFSTTNNTTHDIKQGLKYNEAEIDSQTSDVEQEFLKTSVVNSVPQFCPDEITKNECDLISSQEELFCNTDNTNMSNTSISTNSVPDITKMENPFLSEGASINHSSDPNHQISPKRSADEDLEIINTNENVSISKEDYFESCVTNFGVLESKTPCTEMSDEIQKKELDDKLICVEKESLTDDIKNENNHANEDAEFTITESISQNIHENDSTLVESQKTIDDNDETDNVITKDMVVKNHITSLVPKSFNLRKRFHSRIIQYLVLNDSSVDVTKNKSLNIENISTTEYSKHVNVDMQEENIDDVRPGKMLSELVEVAKNEISSVDVVSAEKSLIGENLLKIENTHSVTDEFSNNDHDLNCVQILQNTGNNFLINETQVDSGPTDCLLKYSEEDFIIKDTGSFTLSDKSNNSRDRSLELNYNDSKINDERECKNEKGRTTLNTTVQLNNNPRASLKRSFSDSALNIHCNDEHSIFASKNLVTIPKKRKKINPTEMTESNQIYDNYNIIQTNRRNSIATLHKEENVSFCILIDNSCVLSEENVESPKICLAEITEDTFEDEFESDSAFTTGKVIFADNAASNAISPERDDLKGNLNMSEVELENDLSPNYIADQSPENKIFDQESWVEDVACVETVFSDDIVEDVVLNSSPSPNTFNVLENYSDCKNDSLICNDSDNIEKIKYIYGDDMCVDDAELEETLYRTPEMDVRRSLNSKESQYLDESCKYYDNDTLEKLLSESNDENEILSSTQSYNETENVSCLNRLKEQSLNNYLKLIPSESTDNCEYEYPKFKSPEKNACEPTQYDIVHSCEPTYPYEESYNHKNEKPRYSSSSSPEVSSTTPEEKSCGILLKITNCNGSISSQVNEFGSNSALKNNHNLSKNKELVSNSPPRKRPLITKAAQKYIPPLKENTHDLKVKLPLPQHSLNKLKILKISKDKPKSDKSPNNPNSIKSCYPKKTKPKFEDVLKSIDEIQIQMHKEKNKKHKQSVPKVVIKKNESGSHYASTRESRDEFNPDLTGRKWQPWVFIEKNCFIDKMALRNKLKAIFSHRKNTYVLAEKFRKYKSVNSANFVITKPKLEDSSSGELKYTIRLKNNY